MVWCEAKLYIPKSKQKHTSLIRCGWILPMARVHHLHDWLCYNNCDVWLTLASGFLISIHLKFTGLLGNTSVYKAHLNGTSACLLLHILAPYLPLHILTSYILTTNRKVYESMNHNLCYMYLQLAMCAQLQPRSMIHKHTCKGKMVIKLEWIKLKIKRKALIGLIQIYEFCSNCNNFSNPSKLINQRCPKRVCVIKSRPECCCFSWFDTTRQS